MTAIDQRRSPVDAAPTDDDWAPTQDCVATHVVADVRTAWPLEPEACEDAHERALATLRYEAVRAEAERRLLYARGATALGGMMSPR